MPDPLSVAVCGLARMIHAPADRGFAEFLSSRDSGEWTDTMRAQAWALTQRYREEVRELGLDPDQLPEPRLAPALAPQLRLAGGRFVVVYPWDPALDAVVARVPGADPRSTPVRSWSAPSTPEAARALLELVRRHAADVDPEAREALEALAGEVPDAVVSEGPMGGFRVACPDGLLERIPGATRIRGRVWHVPGRHEAAVGLLNLVRDGRAQAAEPAMARLRALTHHEVVA